MQCENMASVKCFSGKYLMKEALDEVGNFKIGGRIINKMRFADGTAIIAKTIE